MPSGVYVRTLKARKNISSAAKGRIPWNKGLTINDCRVKKYVENGRSKRFGKKPSESTKLKMSESHKGDRHWNWKGGRYESQEGYIFVKAPKNHRADVRGYIREHDLVMEKHLKRKLEKNEIVHHINGVRNDNRRENLVVMIHNEHNRLHTNLRWERKK